MVPDKTKTRAETQIKVQLIMDPVDSDFIHFPRKTLAKPKLLATADERQTIESSGTATHLDLHLVCATAVEKPNGMDQALRRAAGKEATPQRPSGIAISELDNDDPAHPQNGGAVLICEGCKERERKRYDRKKKKAEDEVEWSQYENDRIIMINEKEYKKWKDVDPSNRLLSPKAKQVEFAMRIACYCRHQENKSPMGYRVVFTLRNSSNNIVAQHISDTFQITDDHKVKDTPLEGNLRPLPVPQPIPQDQYYAQPTLQQYPVTNEFGYPDDRYNFIESQYNLFGAQDSVFMDQNNILAFQPDLQPDLQPDMFESQYNNANMGPYPPPSTPYMANLAFQTPLSPIELGPNGPALSTAVSPTTTQRFIHHQGHHSYSAPTMDDFMVSPTSQGPSRSHSMENFMVSPTTQASSEALCLSRPGSVENFNFSFDFPYPQNSRSGSISSTPINLSRPASPTWEQGGQKRSKVRCIYFYVDEE